jgi:hypothetical protein
MAGSIDPKSNPARCILRGRAAKRDNKLSHSKSLPAWSIRFRTCAPKSSNRVPEAATKSFHGARDKRVIGARFRNIWPVVVVDEWMASPLRKNRFDRDRNST